LSVKGKVYIIFQSNWFRESDTYGSYISKGPRETHIGSSVSILQNQTKHKFFYINNELDRRELEKVLEY